MITGLRKDFFCKLAHWDLPNANMKLLSLFHVYQKTLSPGCPNITQTGSFALGA